MKGIGKEQERDRKGNLKGKGRKGQGKEINRKGIVRDCLGI